MSVPISQMWTVASYVLTQRLRGRKQYPLVLMLEPLFRCNLACAGCGKIQYPGQILRKNLTVEQSLKAVDECGAPIVSIPGGEPLMRDLRADAERGRIYLPQDEIRRFGYSEDELLHGRYTPAFLSLMRFQADRAHAYYRAARAARPPADRRRLIAADIMGGIYRALLREIEARQFRVFEGRIRVATPKKIALALGAYLRGQLAS